MDIVQVEAEILISRSFMMRLSLYAAFTLSEDKPRAAMAEKDCGTYPLQKN